MGHLNAASGAMSLVLLLVLAFPSLVISLCECGYSASDPNNAELTWVFTDLLESDFTKIQNISQSQKWERQQFNVTAEDGRGKYGKAFMADNIDTELSPSEEGSSSRDDLGLGFRVGGALDNNSVPVAELDSTRMDLHWGSYRAGMKVTGVKGTCAAFFWYFNDTQEIDMEFLSREFDPENSIYPVSLVIQTPESKQAGYDASETGNYQRVNLTFDPTDDFHEYRFDYLPGRVLFYADSDLVGEMQGRGVPSVGGHLILAHWSNGNPNWSGGPPEMDALLTVSYVKSYFNSSDPKRLSERVEKCNAAGTSDGAVCAIPDGTAADAKTGGRFLGDDNGQEESGGEGEGKAGDDDEESSSRLSRDASITPVMLVAMVSMTMCFGPAWG